MHIWDTYRGDSCSGLWKTAGRTLAKAAGRAGLWLFFPTHLYYNNNINTRFRPASACGKTTAAEPPPLLLLLLLSFGGLHRRRCSSRSHKLHIRRVAGRAVFVCVSCPPIYMYYYYYFNICFLFLKKNMHTCIMHDESQLWQWGGNLFFFSGCRVVSCTRHVYLGGRRLLL